MDIIICKRPETSLTDLYVHFASSKLYFGSTGEHSILERDLKAVQHITKNAPLHFMLPDG